MFWFSEGEDFDISTLIFETPNLEATTLLLIDDEVFEPQESIILRPFSIPCGRLLFNDIDVINVIITDDDGKVLLGCVSMHAL